MVYAKYKYRALGKRTDFAPEIVLCSRPKVVAKHKRER